jgi:hypothetical protein
MKTPKSGKNAIRDLPPKKVAPAKAARTKGGTTMSKVLQQQADVAKSMIGNLR